MEKRNEDKLFTKISVRGHVRMFIMLAILIGFLVLINKVLSNPYITCDTMDIDSGWMVVANGVTYEDVTVSETQFPMQNKGDTLDFYRTLPEETVNNPVLCLYSIHSVITVYLNDRQIYTTQARNYLEDILPGYGTNVIELPEDYAGGTLWVHYEIKEDSAFEGLQAPVIMDGTGRMSYLFSQNRIGFLIVSALTLLGLALMGISTFLSMRNGKFVEVYFIAAFSFLVGCWCMCNNEMLQLFVVNISYKSYVEYISFYLMALPFTLYFWNRVQKKEIGLYLKIYYGFVVGVQILFFLMTQILHFADIAHYPTFVSWEHVILILAISFYILLVVEERRVYHETEWLITIGFGIAVLVSLAEMIRFNVQKYYAGFLGNKYNSALEYVILVVVLTLVADFASKIFGALYRDARHKVLAQMAYLDELTGLNNRRYFQETLDKLNKRKANYALVSIDMNLLKQMNDSLGHQEGDRALKALADIMRSSFPASSVVCRIGGDEFEVVLMSRDRSLAKRCIKNMLAEMQKQNDVPEETITLSAAYGIAYGDEAEDPNEVFRLADERMYACKEAQHLSRD